MSPSTPSPSVYFLSDRTASREMATMTESQVKTHLTEMLDSFTAGSILHLLADLHRDAAEEARQNDDAIAFEQARLVEHTLVVVGMGIDAARPT